MILLDTHVVIWLAEKPEELSSSANEAIRFERESGILAIAGRTLWEIAFLVHHGRVKTEVPLRAFLREVERSFRVLPLTPEIAERSLDFSSGYPRDPSDQVIGATAVVHGISLVTRDELIRQSNEVNCIW